MKNVLLISPDFPKCYYKFAQAFKKNGCNVLAIGATPYEDLEQGLKESVTEYVQSYEMTNIGKMIDMIGYLENKYGHIEFLESNNEFWLRTDSILREWFSIDSGLYPNQLTEYQKKSSMKKAFIEAGANVAPFVIAKNIDIVKEFVDKYGYPIFAKPDIGVGAAGNYKIENEQELINFFNDKPNVDYIVETFVDGRIITFDGIADSNSDVVVAINEYFPREIFSLHITNDEMVYYTQKDVSEKLYSLGKKIIKALGLKNRFFHTELFLIDTDDDKYFKKGDLVALEVNIRTPGGYTPDLLCFGLSSNIYQMYADVICFGKTDIKVTDRYYAMCASRRNMYQYFFTEEDIQRTYKKELKEVGRYPNVFADLMGDSYYMATFDKEEDALLFADYVKKRMQPTHKSENKISHITGEDRRMLDERERDNKNSDLTICDKHIDGA